MTSIFSSPTIHHEFCDFAEDMRAAFDAHFADPYAIVPAQHFVWNYWHVPGRYTYLRAELPTIVGRDLGDRFMKHLTTWSLLRYGLKPRLPWLSLYINGCEQQLHNDADNGRLAYVFSLTRWDQRRFSGGETLLLRRQAFDGERQTKPAYFSDLMDAVPANFNWLVLFDDRLPHGVSRVSGTMAPREGRLVVHGHLFDVEPLLIGVLPQDALSAAGPELTRDFDRIAAEAGTDLHGVVTFRADIAKTGAASGVRVLADLVWVLRPEGEAKKRAAIAKAMARLETIGPLPQAPGPSILIAALRLG